MMGYDLNTTEATAGLAARLNPEHIAKCLNPSGRLNRAYIGEHFTETPGWAEIARDWLRLSATVADLTAANTALAAECARLKAREVGGFDSADWFWRAMDPDDCGDSPSEAVNRAMVGRFCVCEIASSYSGPTRYGFIAPVLDPESDDEEFVHFETQQEAIDAAKIRAEIAARAYLAGGE